MKTTEELYADALLNYVAEFPVVSLRLLEQAIAQSPDMNELYELAGNTYLMLGDGARALAFYGTAYRKDPSDGMLFTRVFYAAMLQKAHGLMYELESILPAFAPTVEFHAALGNVYASFGFMEKAATQYETAYQISGDIKYAMEAAIVRDRDDLIPALIEKLPADLHALAYTHWQQAHEQFPTPSQDLTCVVTTNLTKKLIENRPKAPPKLDLIAETLQSWRETLKPQNTRVIINFDQPKTHDADTQVYADALAGYCKEFGYELMLKTGNGLRQNVLDALAITDTGFFTLLEHDFLFHDIQPQQNIMSHITRMPFMHIVQFNRRFNVPVRWDKQLWPDARVKGTHMLRTPRFSNNPYIGRTAKIRAHFMPLFSDTNRHEGSNGGAGGLEEQVKDHIANLIRHFGFGFTHRWSGYYLYGKVLDGPRLTHTGI